jgi:transcriptional regulator GlxA family with amidase domain
VSEEATEDLAAAPRRICVLAYEGVEELDLVGVYAPVAKAAGCAVHQPNLEVRLVGPRPVVRGSGGMHLGGIRGLDGLDSCTAAVVPGGQGVRAAAEDPALLSSLRRAHQQGAEIFAVCTGAYLLAVSGVPANRMAIHASKHDLLRAATSAHISSGLVRDGRITTIGGRRGPSLKAVDIAFAVLQRFAPQCRSCVAERMELPPSFAG